MAVLSNLPVPLTKKDITLFHRLFIREVEQLLPVRGSVHFLEPGENRLPAETAELLFGRNHAKVPGLCASLEPAVLEDSLILPIAVADDENVAVLATHMDPVLLGKMAPEWLRELRENVEVALVQVKNRYMFQGSGCYSRSLLELLWDDLGKAPGVFFLVGLPDKSRYSSRGLMKVMQTGHMLEAVLNGPVYYFGGNIFGVYREELSRENFLLFSHRLLGRLKREGLPAVHIGIARAEGNQTLDRVLEDAWRALEAAEHRGPFSLCEASVLRDRQDHPFAPPAKTILRQLQKQWRGAINFSLLLFRVERAAANATRSDLSLAEVIRDSYGDAYPVVTVNSRECYIPLPEAGTKKGLKTAIDVKRTIESAIAPVKVAVGCGYWPCGDFSRTATAVNCRKALMHGSFFGEGPVTLFDHVSLNVSGDYYFDEGDYRQAVRDYREGLRMKPDEVNLLNSLGVALTELNRLKEAVAHFDLVLKKEPGNFMALVNKGFALKILKREDDALGCLASAARDREFASSPVAADISFQLAKLHCSRKEYKQAIRVLEKMKTRNSEKTGYLLFSLLGGAYAAVGQNGKAIPMLEKAIRNNPHDARSLSILGDLYGKEGEGDDIALSLCTRAVSIDDLSADNWYRLAKARFMVEDFDGAHTAIREALQRDRKSADAQYLAGRICGRLGDMRQARKRIQNALRIDPGFPGARRALKEIGKKL